MVNLILSFTDQNYICFDSSLYVLSCEITKYIVDPKLYGKKLRKEVETLLSEKCHNFYTIQHSIFKNKNDNFKPSVRVTL